ncbi:hypothetical protein AVEN_96871-1 [Araneus ventricosus]|uniref:Uncharacterized protein n=1 Tax=Araneus ventricosus TaxID=182803 RepID=A0A4Y2Q9Q8_ARAVE|nr:hypothetical protein AVEN_96871-1 [Araneus ventricosus]
MKWGFESFRVKVTKRGKRAFSKLAGFFVPRKWLLFRDLEGVGPRGSNGPVDGELLPFRRDAPYLEDLFEHSMHHNKGLLNHRALLTSLLKASIRTTDACG